tara:strand:- start:27577 stop:27744 length:168 start_codon:yes stop_codon:yes gene_type:complete
LPSKLGDAKAQASAKDEKQAQQYQKVCACYVPKKEIYIHWSIVLQHKDQGKNKKN